MCQFSIFAPQRCRWWALLLVGSWLAHCETARAQRQPVPVPTVAELLQDESLAGQVPEHIDQAHPLVPALRIAYGSRRVLSQVKDYTAVFIKREQVRGKEITHMMDLKVREQPFSVYLKFREPHAGRQALYVAVRITTSCWFVKRALRASSVHFRSIPTGRWPCRRTAIP